MTTPISDFGSFVIPLMVTGVGGVLLFIPLTTAVLGGVPREQSPRAAAYTNLAVQLGGSISIAVLATVIERRTAFHLDVLAGAFVPGTPALAAIPMPATHAQQFLSLAATQATVLAYADATLLIAWACFASVPIVFLMPRPRGMAAASKRQTARGLAGRDVSEAVA